MESIDIFNICRICMSSSELRSLFGANKKRVTNTKSLPDMVMECTSVDVSECDKLPTMICQKCVYRVNQFYKFREKAIFNDRKLREHIKTATEKSSRNSFNDNSDSLFENSESTTMFDVFCDGDRKEDFSPVKIENNKENDLVILNDNKDEYDVKGIKDEKQGKVKKVSGRKKKLVRDPRLHECETCGKILQTRSSLVRHIRKHTGEKPYPCDVCGKCFRRTEHLITHHRTHTGERPFKCDLCEKAFKQNSTLICHRRTHTGEKPQICTICGKCFAQSVTLTYHMRTHTGETPYKCMICNKGFKHSGNLNIHMRVHSGERPHECKLCFQRFSTTSHLRLHLKAHRGEKDHVCYICSKAFLRKQHLNNHILIHTGAKPYECTYCPKKYTQKVHLQKHIKVHQLSIQNLVKNSENAQN